MTAIDFRRLIVAGWSALVAASTALAAAPVEFNRDVRPILADRCFACHGPDAARRKAELRLDERDAAIEAGAIVPNEPGDSPLVERIFSTGADMRMPPAESNKPLTGEQKDTLRRWIAEGAAYQKHWSYEPPRRSEFSTGASGVDRLVRKRLTRVGLKPSPQANRRTLIRRLYADLAGLPPTPEEVAAFEADARPGAYERLVDRLLESPHFGERMAIGWLDLVRFADTIGYHSDNPRNVWPYRDWVIESFNRNKPFDRFTIEQLAGDLLPDASPETRVGSAFNRLLLSTEEGGAQPKDYEARMLTDRVRAVGTVWLGQTTGCAQCHDHKFDPFTARDFYSLGAFFADIEEPVIGRREAGMVVAAADESRRLAEFDAALAAAQQSLDAVAAEINASQAAWEATLRASGAAPPDPAFPAESAAPQRKAAIAALRKAADKQSARDKQAIRAYYRNHVEALHRAEIDAVRKAEKARAAYYDRLPKCLVSASTADRRSVRILPRGNWMDDSGPVVRPALPHYLPQPPVEGRELTRLDLAQWLVSRENPLTARVFVNRLWKQFFGIGLSRVLDDLGTQGEPPRNPELLDALACEFMDSGWDVKHMVRTIVTSRTYRQVSTATPELLAADPDNRELARQSAFRLDAELVRDYALSIAGILSPRIGGPSVKPYQPAGYWENLNFPAREYVADTGEAQHRRGLYVWWQRTFLHPSLLAFDAPSREECCAERSRSNLPQQALVLLNDPTYVEASRAFAARIVSECPGSADDRIAWAWQQALQRPPRPDERQIAVALLEKHRQIDRDQSELAAWTHVARVLLNLHETITRN